MACSVHAVKVISQAVLFIVGAGTAASPLTQYVCKAYLWAIQYRCDNGAYLFLDL